MPATPQDCLLRPHYVTSWEPGAWARFSRSERRSAMRSRQTWMNQLTPGAWELNELKCEYDLKCSFSFYSVIKGRVLPLSELTQTICQCILLTSLRVDPTRQHVSWGWRVYGCTRRLPFNPLSAFHQHLHRALIILQQRRTSSLRTCREPWRLKPRLQEKRERR